MSVPTDQQILDALRTALYNLAVSGAQSYTINGRVFTRVDIKNLEEAISLYESRVDAATSQGGIAGGTVIVHMGVPQ